MKSRDADGYLGFWNVEPENRQDHINWILHEQEYINLAFVRNYRVLPKNPQLFAALAEAPLEDLQRLRHELSGFVQELAATA